MLYVKMSFLTKLKRVRMWNDWSLSLIFRPNLKLIVEMPLKLICHDNKILLDTVVTYEVRLAGPHKIPDPPWPRLLGSCTCGGTPPMLCAALPADVWFPRRPPASWERSVWRPRTPPISPPSDLPVRTGAGWPAIPGTSSAWPLVFPVAAQAVVPVS